MKREQKIKLRVKKRRCFSFAGTSQNSVGDTDPTTILTTTVTSFRI